MAPTQSYRVTSIGVADVGSGDTDQSYTAQAIVADGSDWRGIEQLVGENSASTRQESFLIYQLGPSAQEPAALAIPVGSTINAAKLTVLPTIIGLTQPTVLFVTMLPDGRWDQVDRINPQHFSQKIPLRIVGSTGTIGESNATINTSNFRGRPDKYAGGYGHDEAGQVILATATGTLTSVVVNFQRRVSGQPAGKVAFCEIWSVDGSDNKVALLATSATILLTALPLGTNAVTTFTFATGPTLTSGVRYLAIVKNDTVPTDVQAVQFGMLNATVTEPFVSIGKFRGFMWGNYPGGTVLPYAFVGNTDTPSASRFQTGSSFLIGTWVVGVPFDVTTGLVALLQGWIDSIHYATGGLFMLVWSPLVGPSGFLSNHGFAAFDNVTSDGALLEVTWTEPPPPVGFPAACVEAGAEVVVLVGAGADAPAVVAAGHAAPAVVNSGADAPAVVTAGAGPLALVDAGHLACPEAGA